MWQFQGCKERSLQELNAELLPAGMPSRIKDDSVHVFEGCPWLFVLDPIVDIQFLQLDRFGAANAHRTRFKRTDFTLACAK